MSSRENKGKNGGTKKKTSLQQQSRLHEIGSNIPTIDENLAEKQKETSGRGE